MSGFSGQVLLGKLRVVRLIGRGGMATVYEVEHTLTRHRRALKVMKESIAEDEDLAARFLREASVAGTLQSPYVAETYDAGTLDDGSLYVLMELLRGESLGRFVRRLGRVRPGVAARIGIEICEGLQVAHDNGVVHRDLKPDNVFLATTRRGVEVKILDFGISKFVGRATVTTESGQLLGTPHYMSPEQLRDSRDIGPRSDLYSVGVILYRMLCGLRPYEMQSLPSLVFDIYEGNCPRVNERISGLDERLADVVMKAMAVEVDSRFADARELAVALQPFACRSLDGLVTAPPRSIFNERPRPSDRAVATAAASGTVVPESDRNDAATMDSPVTDTDSVSLPIHPRHRMALLGAMVLAVVGLAALIAFVVSRPAASGERPAPAPIAVEAGPADPGTMSATVIEPLPMAPEPVPLADAEPDVAENAQTELDAGPLPKPPRDGRDHRRSRRDGLNLRAYGMRR